MDEAEGRSNFATTQWSLVLRAAQPNDDEARSAMEVLCRRYWLPLYAFARRRLSTIDEAQDLTQEFFLRLIEKNVLATATPERGRFRSFLLTSLRNFLANEWDRKSAKKRGGQGVCLSIDWEVGESRLSVASADFRTPEQEFERQWALTLLEVVIQRLQKEFTDSGKNRQFDLLKDTLTGRPGGLDYRGISAELGLSEDATRQAAHRMRRRYRELLREEVACTLGSSQEVDDEIDRLFEALAS